MEPHHHHLYAHVSVADLIGLTRLPSPCRYPGSSGAARLDPVAAAGIDALARANGPLNDGGAPGEASPENLACLCDATTDSRPSPPGPTPRLTDRRYRWTSPLVHAHHSVPEPKTDPRHR